MYGCCNFHLIIFVLFGSDGVSLLLIRLIIVTLPEKIILIIAKKFTNTSQNRLTLLFNTTPQYWQIKILQ